MMDVPGGQNNTLMLAETESEKTKWVMALSELHRIFKRNKLPVRMVSFFLSLSLSYVFFYHVTFCPFFLVK